MTSLADRITKPDDVQAEGDTANVTSSAPTNNAATAPSAAPPTTSSWADEAEDELAETSSTNPTAKADAKEDNGNVPEAQTDGASERMGGEMGVIEPNYEVEIKLADIQANPNDPLYSIKSFEQLGL